MVKSANMNGLLDSDSDSLSSCQQRVKARLHEILQKDRDFTAEDYEKVGVGNLCHCRCCFHGEKDIGQIQSLLSRWKGWTLEQPWLLHALAHLQCVPQLLEELQLSNPDPDFGFVCISNILGNIHYEVTERSYLVFSIIYLQILKNTLPLTLGILLYHWSP